MFQSRCAAVGIAPADAESLHALLTAYSAKLRPGARSVA